jgi:NAD+ diphosphatase
VLLNLPLSRSTLDRAAHLRADQAAIDELWKRAKVIEMLGDKFKVTTSGLNFQSSKDVEGERYFLGLDNDGVPYFVTHRSTDQKEFPEDFKSLRTIGALLNSLEIGAAVHALALTQWHEVHQKCSKCGASTHPTFAGAVRECDVCEASHHPRTDPAIIVLVKDTSDRILLGRQKIWPAKRFSTFAGFVEPGESFESCVSREVLEECGGQVTEMNYLGSQPWPFPASIMIAYEATISNPDSVKADGEEIEEIIWLSRSEIKEKCDSGELLLPPIISVARAMINAWYGPNAAAELQGGESWRN